MLLYKYKKELIMQDNKPKEKIESLQALRTIAFLGIFLSHFRFLY